MALSIKIDPINVEAFFKPGGFFSPQEMATKLADFARVEIAKSDAQNAKVAGHTVPHTTVVDGSRAPDLSGVKSDSVIITEWHLFQDVVQYCYDAVVAKSPVLTGAYKKSHLIFADDVLVSSPAETKGADEVVIVSTVPYARKIEGGLSTQAPDGVYEGVATMAKRRFGNVAKIRFTYVSPVGGSTALQNWAQKHAMRAGKNFNRQLAKDIRQPAIIIYFR